MNNLKVGTKALITTDGWFFGPDGELYKSVFGTIKGVYSSEETLGIKTNAKSTNWYVVIGNMTLAGCQIHYAIETDNVSFAPTTIEMQNSNDGKNMISKSATTRIYNADKKYKPKKGIKYGR